MGKRQVGVEVLLRTQVDFQSVQPCKLNEHGKEQQLKHFRNDFGIDRDCVNAPVDVDETFDDPLALISRHCFSERSRVGLKFLEELFGRHVLVRMEA